MEIARVCGFADQSHFTPPFTGTVGVSPGAWRRMHGVPNKIVTVPAKRHEWQTPGRFVLL